jgi:hypothetical protein
VQPAEPRRAEQRLRGRAERRRRGGRRRRGAVQAVQQPRDVVCVCVRAAIALHHTRQPAHLAQRRAQPEAAQKAGHRQSMQLGQEDRSHDDSLCLVLLQANNTM